IRVFHVTGVQTCALPIFTNLGANSELGVAAQLHRLPEVHALLARGDLDWRRTRAVLDAVDHLDDEAARAVVADVADQLTVLTTEIGRASCREREAEALVA